MKGGILEDPTLYRMLFGSLIYLTITRPDILYVVHIVSKLMQAPQHLLLVVIHLIIQYIFGIPGYDLFFPTSSSLQLQANYDANWAGYPDTRKSTTILCLFLENTRSMIVSLNHPLKPNIVPCLLLIARLFGYVVSS
jgi:hypothetical protein